MGKFGWKLAVILTVQGSLEEAETNVWLGILGILVSRELGEGETLGCLPSTQLAGSHCPKSLCFGSSLLVFAMTKCHFSLLVCFGGIYKVCFCMAPRTAHAFK